MESESVIRGRRGIRAYTLEPDASGHAFAHSRADLGEIVAWVS